MPYEDTKRGRWRCECGWPAASAGTSNLACIRHFPLTDERYASRYFGVILNTYQAARLLDVLEAHPELNSGDWYGELQLLLRNQGILPDLNRIVLPIDPRF